MTDKLFISLVFIWIGLAMMNPAEARQPQHKIKADSSHVQQRIPPADQIHKYAQSQDFRYGSTAGEDTSIWNIIARWLWENIAKLLSYKSTRLSLKILFYTLFVIFVVMLVKQFTFGSLFRKNGEELPDINVQQHESTQRNLDPAIQKSIAEENFSLAVRLMYQRGLMMLQQHHVISWERRKTNHDYIYEIQKPEVRQLFQKVTRSYEYAEYGNFSISRVTFKRVQQQFYALDRLVQES